MLFTRNCKVIFLSCYLFNCIKLLHFSFDSPQYIAIHKNNFRHSASTPEQRFGLPTRPATKQTTSREILKWPDRNDKAIYISTGFFFSHGGCLFAYILFSLDLGLLTHLYHIKARLSFPGYISASFPIPRSWYIVFWKVAGNYEGARGWQLEKEDRRPRKSTRRECLF